MVDCKSILFRKNFPFMASFEGFISSEVDAISLGV